PQHLRSMIDIPKDELATKYLDEGWSIEQCADHFGCSTTTVERRLRSYDLTARSPGNRPVEVSKTELERLYVEQGLTTIEVGEILGCHPSTVGSKLKAHGISTTGANHGHSIDIPEDELVSLYLDEGLTTYDLGDRYGCHPTVIERRLRWYGIEDRHTGPSDDPWEYKYGSSWRRQRKQALERADYRCERCGITDAEHRETNVEPTRGVGFGLDVHHRVSVRLFKRWDLSIEDANQLSNLEVLCQSCHRDFGDRVGTFEVIEE
ncbi:MAG: HNH endonuclease, partial [Halobacteriales archaeon]|nr:HNH endonuclease [Halobacteriales archaeon]